MNRPGGSPGTVTGGSIAFDRAADYYDRTRALPPEVMERVTELLVDELAGRGTALEIGVGTGRIALPLHEGGVELIGVDISKQMLDKLIERAAATSSGTAPAGAMPFPVLLGDATRLPFATNSLRAAIAAHVLHLISDWRHALDEVVRVLTPGGVFLVDLGRWGTGRMQEITEYWSRAAGLEVTHPGLFEAEVLDDAMKARGGRVRELEQISGSRTMTYEAAISQYEAGLWSFTWKASEEARRAAAEKTRRWVQERFGPLDQQFTDDVVVSWRAYDLWR
jgi:ubiquinone/menaquinone biosynthesis C-methylase UbiE